MAVGDRIDPYAQFNFLVEIDGLTVAGFTEVSGLMTEQDIIEYREGNEAPTFRKLPGINKPSKITCKRGVDPNLDLWLWRKTTLDGKTERRDGAVILLDEARQPVLRWEFRSGWVSKYDGPALNSKTSDAAFQTVEIVHEGLDVSK
jgi:phage tail-like protein